MENNKYLGEFKIDVIKLYTEMILTKIKVDKIDLNDIILKLHESKLYYKFVKKIILAFF